MARDFLERLRLDDHHSHSIGARIARSNRRAQSRANQSRRPRDGTRCRHADQSPRIRCGGARTRSVIRNGASKRLARAAEFALERAINSPKSQRQHRAGFAFAACEIAYQSLRDSGVSASGWLTSSATRRALAIYNTSLAIFVSEYSRALAGGNTTLNVPTPFGPRTVAARYSPQSRYRPGYFDDLIPADFIKIAGFKKRVRVEGLGVPLVGVRERTADRKTELLFSHRIVAPMWRWDALQISAQSRWRSPNANRHLRPRSDRKGDL